MLPDLQLAFFVTVLPFLCSNFFTVAENIIPVPLCSTENPSTACYTYNRQTSELCKHSALNVNNCVTAVFPSSDTETLSTIFPLASAPSREDVAAATGLSVDQISTTYLRGSPQPNPLLLGGPYVPHNSADQDTQPTAVQMHVTGLSHSAAHGGKSQRVLTTLLKEAHQRASNNKLITLETIEEWTKRINTKLCYTLVSNQQELCWLYPSPRGYDCFLVAANEDTKNHKPCDKYTANSPPVLSFAQNPFPSNEDAEVNINIVGVQDLDATDASHYLHVTLEASIGEMKLDSVGIIDDDQRTLSQTTLGNTKENDGIEMLEVDGNTATIGVWTTNKIKFQARINPIKDILAALWYRAPQDVNSINNGGNPTITVNVNDVGNQGASVEQETDTLEINVQAVNDLATVSATPGLQTIEDTTMDFSSLTINDVDCYESPSCKVEVTVSSTDGTFTILSNPSGPATAKILPDTSLEVVGDLNTVRGFLQTSIEWTPSLDRDTDTTITFNVDDQGNTGSGPALATVVLPVAISAVNDAPELSLNSAISTNEDEALGGLDISVTDVDSVAGFSLVISADIGDWEGGGNGPSGVLSWGAAETLVDLNDFIQNQLTYTPPKDYQGDAAVTLSVSDGVDTVDLDFTLTITGTNDPPQLQVTPTPNAGLTVETGTAFSFSGIDADHPKFSISDPDHGYPPTRVTQALLLADNWSCSFALPNKPADVDLDFAFGGVVQFAAPLAKLNAALEGLELTCLVADPVVTVTVLVNDFHPLNPLTDVTRVEIEVAGGGGGGFGFPGIM
eukprot:TRINITY_DN63590_c0_g1_i1.p1 TRINITY_DN63590_c0_g1~~TRINITY_DN63590_c0_g1_i1.p1  ORF type:complete len:791 (+),score=95.01 TRINITY_DN63590_c0_g1_i1:96-2468(+)